MFSKLKNLATGEKEPEPQEQSLATILPTAEDRANFLLLVADAIESMERQVLDIFDADKAGLSEPIKIKFDLTIDSETESAEEDPSEEPEAAGEKEKGEEALKKEYEKRLKELSLPANIELKQFAQMHFEEWRSKVLERVGEAVNQHDSKEKPEQPATKNSDITPDDPSEGVKLRGRYPPQETPLKHLDKARRVLILHSLLLLLLGLEFYSAESRVLMLRVASSLHLTEKLLADDETAVARGLIESANHQRHMSADEETRKKIEENSTSRKWKVGLGAAAGAVLIGVTGGLAAPLLAAGVGAVMGGIGLGATATAGYLGALAGSAPLVGILFGAYGARMTSHMVDEYAKEVEDFAFLPIKKPSMFGGGGKKAMPGLRVGIAISGWLTDEAEVTQPWLVLSGQSTEAFALRWELKALMNLGHSLTTYIKSYAWGWAKKELLARTIFATLSSALTLPYGLAKAARVVDNPFSVAKARSDKAGVILADALINKVQGERPVTLIGFSLGARAIYACLAELANRKAFGLVESVCLVGAPVPSDPLAWRKIRAIVSGRVVNVYSEKDYLLAFLYRASSLQYGIAGLRAIESVQGIENFDASDMIDGHTQYRFLIGKILDEVELESVDQEALERQLSKYRKEQLEAKERKKRQKGGGDADEKKAEDEADEMEKEVQQKSRASQAMNWVSDKVSGFRGSGGNSEDKNKDATPEETMQKA